MLDIKKNRMDYGEQLIPPYENYDLDYAVGTTYSLDLEAIAVLPVALFYSRLLDCSADELHFDVLDAIIHAADKIRVYCQKGKIKVPKKYNYLMAYWEKGISQIRMDSYFQSFHPKVWIIRFVSQSDKPLYRLLITSRNLTFAHDWDIAFSTDGIAGNKPIEKNKPLLDFLYYLTDKDGRDLPEDFIKDLSTVDFELPEGFNSMNFFPIGFEGRKSQTIYTNPMDKKKWDDLICISPFIDDKTLSLISDQSNNLIAVLSGKEELDGISETLVNEIGEDRFYQFSEFIRNAERIDGVSDDSRLEIQLQNLHAKIFIGSKGYYQHWLLGSANCTQPAFGRNIEFMVELKTDQNTLSPNKMFKMLTQPKNDELPLFDPYRLENRIDDSEQINIGRKLRELIYNITGLDFKGQAIPRTSENNIWDLNVNCDTQQLIIPAGFEVKIKPVSGESELYADLEAGKINTLSFKGFNEIQLSPYLEVMIQFNSELKKTFIIEMVIDLPETRMNNIFRLIIDSKEKFLKYLSFLLGGQAEAVNTYPVNRNGGRNKENITNPFLTSALYENLMITASRNPEDLKPIANIIEKLKEQVSDNENIITDDFMKLWNVFKALMEKDSK